ncbi:MAG TPA: substrate-binding domain-containing protein [Taishania sp.]|nr:substrate-binding domain-containing protein [Taishania sp.]
MKLRVGGVPEHFNLPWKLALEDGEFKKEGIEVHWTDMPGGTGQMLRGFENKTLDVAVMLTEGITKGILQGLNAKIVDVYVTSPLHWGIHVPFHSNYTKVEQLENQTFAISRMGSGSHLMAYVCADRMGWDTTNLKFNVIGDVYGGIWALEHNEAQLFLWDKYMTHPFTTQEKCRYIDEVITPWPCFVIAAREEVIQENPEAIKLISKIVNERALVMKNSEHIVEIISWRYNLRSNQVQNWLSETDWNYNLIKYPLAFEKTVRYLVKLNLITETEAENWREKLFFE